MLTWFADPNVKGIKIAAADMNTLALEELEPLPAWNYTLQPRC